MGHSAGDLVGKFCTQRKDSCKNGQKYKDNANQGLTKNWPRQAHHVLCVASVTQYISTGVKIEIVMQTDWCINTVENMLAMPTWRSVTEYYAAQLRKSDLAAEPEFKDIPMHTYNHNSKNGYKSEIDAKMQEIADAANKSTEKHEVSSATLKSALDGYRNIMKPRLKRRGKRQDGTHVEWLRGYAGQASANWYEPFSMADLGNIEARSFPLKRSKASIQKVLKLVEDLI